MLAELYDAVTRSAVAVAPRLRALVAEDDDAMRIFLQRVLEDEGFEVVPASDGAEAARHLCVDPGHMEWFDLVVTDYRMPRVTGLELATWLRSYPGRPPVVVLSAFADDALEHEARRAGVAVVLAKPFSLWSFLEAVRSLTEQDRS